jgi:hypothetical protein
MRGSALEGADCSTRRPIRADASIHLSIPIAFPHQTLRFPAAFDLLYVA